MIKDLKFVMGAVGKKDLIPALTHFKIQDSTIRSFNGTIALSSPIQLDLQCAPKAVPFYRAIEKSEDTVSLIMTKNGKLQVRSGKFKVLIDCIEEETPHVLPDGDEFQIDGVNLLAAFKTLSPFIGSDASRPWANGVLLDGQSAFATNNIIICEYWVGSKFPVLCNVPAMAVKEMIRINEPPTHAQCTENSITFHYEGDRWIRSQLFTAKWPDVSKILDVHANTKPVPDELAPCLETLKPFTSELGEIYLLGNKVRTHLNEEEGAEVEVRNLNSKGILSLGMLNLVLGVAEEIDFSSLPRPAIFSGKLLRGAIIGMQIQEEIVYGS